MAINVTGNGYIIKKISSYFLKHFQKCQDEELLAPGILFFE